MHFPPRWIHGSPDCRSDPDPAFQVHRLAEGTYALRESKCYSFEAPFLYLLQHLRAARTIKIAVYSRPFQKFIGGHQLLKPRRRYKKVINAVDFACAW